MNKSLYASVLCVLIGVFSGTGNLLAMPPTEEAVQKWIADGVYDQKIRNWIAFKEAGGCAPNELSPLKTLRGHSRAALATEAVDTINVIVIMVEFTDWLASAQNVFGTAQAFDSLLFSQKDTDPVFNTTGSMTDFYLENSYGSVFIKGDIFGWYMMPKTYAYYATNDGLGGTGRELAGAAVDAAEADGVDFSQYANGDYWVDGVIVIHAGAGAETGVYGIWSHLSNMTQRDYDGVGILSYTMNPEEYGFGLSSMGVYGHEYGHVLGLPDLYDIDDSSPGAGLGKWSMMAGGSWNDFGRSPAHFDPWCKMQLGFVNVVFLDSNLYHVEFPQVESNPVVYGLEKNPGGYSPQYWLVENRQRVGFDVGLPGSGLCIYHVDDEVLVQDDRSRYKVALEQADGRNDLAINGNSDNGDPWPGSKNNRDFHDRSVPNSKGNFLFTTQNGVWSISNPDSIMYADLDIDYSRPWVIWYGATPYAFTDSVPDGDGDGVPEEGETISFYLKVINKMRPAYDPVATLAVDQDNIEFVNNDVYLESALTTNTVVSNTEPIKFTIPYGFESVIARLELTLVADSVEGSGDSAFMATFEFDHTLGAPQLLLVDDDGGESWQDRYITSLGDLRVPIDTLTKTAGSPTGAELLTYNTVFWHMGRNQGYGGALTADDVLALKDFLDGGGNLFLTSITAASQLHALDSAFMADYLHATLVNTNVFGLGCVGYSGSEVGDGVSFTYYGSAPMSPFHDIVAPVGRAEEAFHLADDFAENNFGTNGISFAGDYRTVFLTFPAEFIAEGSDWLGTQPKDSLFTRVLDFFRHNYPVVSKFFIEGENPSMVVDHTPTFGWMMKDTAATTQSQVEIEVGSDGDWTVVEMWTTGAVTSSDTSIVYAGAALEEGLDYYIRIRVDNGSTWSDWRETAIHMNSLPSTPSPLEPLGGQYVDATPDLTVLNAYDAESPSLWYEYEVYADESLASMVVTSPHVDEYYYSTTWTVNVLLDELTPYWWRARSFDGAEYSNWSDSATFTVNSAYEPPSGSLLMPYTSTSFCDSSIAVQPVRVEASKPLVSAVIPVRIPDEVEDCEVSFTGLATEGWDLNSVVMERDSGFLVVSLENSLNFTLPPETTTVFNIYYTVPILCGSDYTISWDTSRYAIPDQELRFTDTMEVFLPDFDGNQYIYEINGYTPGDFDEAPTVDIGDLTHMIAYLFINGPQACNMDATDVNGDCEGPDIGDLTAIISYLYITTIPPVCGCVAAGTSPASKERSDIAFETITKDGETIIALMSPVSLRGIQLEMSVPEGTSVRNLLEGRLDLLSGGPENDLQVALVDLDGLHMIKPGRTEILQVSQECEILDVLVADLNHTVWSPAAASVAVGDELPDHYALDQNYPNPFNPSTQMSFALPEAGSIKLDIFNILGQRVKTLADGEYEAGYHFIQWDGTASSGDRVASGVYLYRMTAGEFTQTKKMILLK